MVSARMRMLANLWTFMMAEELNTEIYFLPKNSESSGALLKHYWLRALFEENTIKH